MLSWFDIIALVALLAVIMIGGHFGDQSNASQHWRDEEDHHRE